MKINALILIIIVLSSCSSKSESNKYFYDVTTGQQGQPKSPILLYSNLYLCDTNRFNIEKKEWGTIMVYEDYPFEQHKKYSFETISIPSKWYVIKNRKTRFELKNDSIVNLIKKEYYDPLYLGYPLGQISDRFYEFKNIKIIKTKNLINTPDISMSREDIYIEPNLEGESAVQITLYYNDSIKNFKTKSIDKNVFYYLGSGSNGSVSKV